MDWSNLAQYREKSWFLVKTVLNLRDPQNVGNRFTRSSRQIAPWSS